MKAVKNKKTNLDLCFIVALLDFKNASFASFPHPSCFNNLTFFERYCLEVHGIDVSAQINFPNSPSLLFTSSLNFFNTESFSSNFSAGNISIVLCTTQILIPQILSYLYLHSFHNSTATSNSLLTIQTSNLPQLFSTDVIALDSTTDFVPSLPPAAAITLFVFSGIAGT
ncbi:hypothetical protein BB559_007075 [Furculomyces boomerangus]|uniref:Uncharacterized protein n=1 Tax=Furculomyces boomerangus TaxID=61424 RepID=A0A2T9XZ45_9FUNG|nr:hypothetical protein BB559_007075 [Furculomyces boomerangus]